MVDQVCTKIPLFKSDAVRSHCWVVHWKETDLLPKFDATQYARITTPWNDLMKAGYETQPRPQEKGSLATDTRRPTNWINWVSVMSRHYCCKSEWITRKTVQIQFSRGLNLNQVMRVMETQFGPGATVVRWDGSDLTSHFIPINSGPRLVVHYHVETEVKWVPWQERPPSFYSMWGMERRPLISDPYALTIGDQSIRRNGSNWRKVGQLMGTTAVRKYVD